MTTAPTEQVTRTVTEQVTVEPTLPKPPKPPKPPKRPKRGRRLLNWLKRVGRGIKSWWKKMRRWTKRNAIAAKDHAVSAGHTAVDWTKRGASGTWRGIKWVGNKAYWSGAAVGRTAGRTARFLGRGSWRLVRATPRFLGRTMGWGLRAVSWTFREALATVFRLSMAAFLAVGALMLVLSFTHDKYEAKVHRQTVAWSRGQTKAKKTAAPKGFGAAEQAVPESDWAVTKVAQYAGVVPVAVGKKAKKKAKKAAKKAKKATKTTTVTTEIIPVQEDESIHAKAEPVPEPVYVPIDRDHMNWAQIWVHQQKRDVDLGVPPPQISEQDATFAFHYLSMIHEVEATPRKHPDQPWKWTPIPETEEGKGLTDNQLFQGKSYWYGRYEGFLSTEQEISQTDLTLPWRQFSEHISTKAKAQFKIMNDDLKDEYEARNFHQANFRRGFNDALAWCLDRVKPVWEQFNATRQPVTSSDVSEVGRKEKVTT